MENLIKSNSLNYRGKDYQYDADYISSPLIQKMDSTQLQQDKSDTKPSSKTISKDDIATINNQQKFHSEHKNVVKGMITDKRTQIALRIFAALFVLGRLWGNTFRTKSVNTIGNECFRDQTFIWTQSINKYLDNNWESVTRYLTIISTLGLDFMMSMMLLLLNKKWETLRMFLCFAIFLQMKQTVQNLFSMQRLPGKLLRDPGTPSLSIPYHDCNDFYPSGHLGTSVLLLSEFYISGI